MDQEEVLIERAKAGDREAFGSLYGTYIKRIYDFVYFRVACREVAEDLVSGIFIKTMENLLKFEPAKGSFSSWIYRIARNHVIDHYRTSKPQSSLDDAELSDEGRQVERAEDAIFFDQADKLLKRLKPEQRDVVIMRVWDELPYAEIAAITGKSEAAAKMSFKRAAESLRRIAPQDWLSLLALFLVLKDR
jgi:RNA polymerase sigma-70 factor (ECF subfamily)